MKCPEGIRQCPHGWVDCEFCANVKACDAGTYIPETELTESELTVDLGIPIVDVQDIPPVKPISERGTWAERFNQMSEEERWAEYGKYRTPDFNEKLVLPAGPIKLGGGSKNKSKRRKKKGSKIFTSEWGVT
ncbi:MAG TPA: hypothetical protein VN456_06575 [Desulfosporosinus sp.]|nr:hypothetical protein [Desulfosporosinus sp.]